MSECASRALCIVAGGSVRNELWEEGDLYFVPRDALAVAAVKSNERRQRVAVQSVRWGPPRRDTVVCHRSCRQLLEDAKIRQV
jgi:hypothetical protein